MDGGKPAPWWRAENEGPLLHDFTHYFDLLDLYAGEVDWLCGMAEQRSRPWAVEDFTAAFIKFKSGVTALASGAELSEYDDSGMELRGSTGVIRYGRSGLRAAPVRAGRLRAGQRLPVEHAAAAGTWNMPPDNSTYVSALEELAGALDGGNALRSDGEVGRRSLEIVMGIYQSQLEGCAPVRFPVSLTSSGVQALRDTGHFAEPLGGVTHYPTNGGKLWK